MKKILLLLLISFTAQASFLPESKVGQDTDGMTIYSKKAKCESVYSESCISIRKTGNMDYHEVKPDTQLKEQSEVCTDESDCIAKFDLLECASENFHKIRTAEHDEVYCTKFEPAHIVEDETKKSSHMAKVLKKSNRLAKVNKGKERRSKCENALSYLSGSYEDSTEAETDAIFGAFADIDSSLSRCKYKKAKRLIGEITDSNYLELRTELLEILE